jgi:hypothetical protein
MQPSNEVKMNFEYHKLKIHNQMVIMFATLLFKTNRIMDCFTVLNTYGRKCLIYDKLTRANIYRLLAMVTVTLETENEDAAVKALNHCDKAIEKFKSLGSNQGLASCLLLKMHILQVIKYTEDPLDSDEDENDQQTGSLKTVGNSSRVANVRKHFYKVITKGDDTFQNLKITHIIDYVKKSSREEPIINLTQDQDVLELIISPILIIKVYVFIL